MSRTRLLKHLSITALFLAAAAFATVSHAAVIRTSSYGSYQEALDACTGEDLLLIDDDKDGEFTDPPSGLQISGPYEVVWNLTQDVSDLVFFNHEPRIRQTGGIMKRCVATYVARKSKFVGLDSCFFVLGSMSRDNVNYEIEGYLRHTTFGFGAGYIGGSTCNLKSFNCAGHTNETWLKHASLFLINATDPEGDGSGTLITNLITHGQIDWTPVHIINGRGITVSHINSEYVEWSDPHLSIENGVECASICQTPGGKQRDIDWHNWIELQNGTKAYVFMDAAYGVWRIGGMNNTAIGGTGYVGFRSAVTGASWSSLVARDPYLTKWNPVSGDGVNYAAGIRTQAYGMSDRSMLREDELRKDKDDPFAQGYVMNSEVGCTTAIINSNNTIFEEDLKPNTLRLTPQLIRPYSQKLPRIKFDGDGPGTDMTGMSGAEIASAVNSGNVVYLGPGEYFFSTTLKNGTIYGSGKDKTILKFSPALDYCTSTPIRLFNLTIDGGEIGYAQTEGPNTGIDAANVRFANQSLAGISFGNAQNVQLQFLEFDNCHIGIATCAGDIHCGENPDGSGKMIDKLAVYGSTFRNLQTGANLVGGTDGFMSFVGCRFENITATALLMQSKGNYVTDCDFVNCGTAASGKYTLTVHNCSVQGGSSSEGFKGVHEIMSCHIRGCEPAVQVSTGFGIVSDVDADGSIMLEDNLFSPSENTWISHSKFTNRDAENGAYIGSTDMSEYVDNSPVLIDQTAPTAPTGLQVTADGDHNVLTWTGSEDPESKVMQYIIERGGQEIGRTNWNHSADFYYIVPNGWDDGHPGPGLYRDPSTVYIDSGAAGQFSASDYSVVAVNHAQIRSDGEMAQLRLWFDHVSPNRLTGNKTSDTTWEKLSDSVYVPLGPLTMTEAAGGKSYKAVRYLPESGSGLEYGNKPPETGSSVRLQRIKPNTSLIAPDARVFVYNLKGARVGVLEGRQVMKVADMQTLLRSNLKLAAGSYVIPMLQKKVTLVGGVR